MDKRKARLPDGKIVGVWSKLRILWWENRGLLREIVAMIHTILVGTVTAAVRDRRYTNHQYNTAIESTDEYYCSRCAYKIDHGNTVGALLNKFY